MHLNLLAHLTLLVGFFLGGAFGFTAPHACSRTSHSSNNNFPTFPTTALHAGDDSAAAAADPNEVVARRIVVVGDVAGGYYRSCVKNEASRFRKLIGTMTPPEDDEKRAEIYVEGKRKFIEGFVRWCERGDVGLSQAIKVESVTDESPTGMFDEFYVQTGRDAD